MKWETWGEEMAMAYFTVLLHLSEQLGSDGILNLEPPKSKQRRDWRETQSLVLLLLMGLMHLMTRMMMN
jgi:hypothetical protein